MRGMYDVHILGQTGCIETGKRGIRVDRLLERVSECVLLPLYSITLHD